MYSVAIKTWLIVKARMLGKKFRGITVGDDFSYLTVATLGLAQDSLRRGIFAVSFLGLRRLSSFVVQRYQVNLSLWERLTL